MTRESDPIFFLPLQTRTMHTTAGNWTDNKIRNADGLVERLPILCHQGDDYEARKQHPRARNRYVMIVRHEGHTVPLLLTNGAAHLDVATTYAQNQRLKARALGWFVLGSPLCRQIKARDVAKSKIVSDQVRESKKLCPVKGDYSKGCKCTRLEIAARHEKHGAAERTRDSYVEAAALKHETALASAVGKGVGAEMRTALRELLDEKAAK